MGKKTQKNGLYLFDQYQMEKYEKIGSTWTRRQCMKISYSEEWNLFWCYLDTSRVTGRDLSANFINETLSDIYGDNKLGKREYKS
jgi:hypothetical protein